jgi:hypothetical protein
MSLKEGQLFVYHPAPFRCKGNLVPELSTPVSVVNPKYNVEHIHDLLSTGPLGVLAQQRLFCASCPQRFRDTSKQNSAGDERKLPDKTSSAIQTLGLPRRRGWNSCSQPSRRNSHALPIQTQMEALMDMQQSQSTIQSKNRASMLTQILFLVAAVAGTSVKPAFADSLSIAPLFPAITVTEGDSLSIPFIVTHNGSTGIVLGERDIVAGSNVAGDESDSLLNGQVYFHRAAATSTCFPTELLGQGSTCGLDFQFTPFPTFMGDSDHDSGTQTLSAVLIDPNTGAIQAAGNIEVTVNDPGIVPQPVPEPPTILLFGTAALFTGFAAVWSCASQRL